MNNSRLLKLSVIQKIRKSMLFTTPSKQRQEILIR